MEERRGKREDGRERVEGRGLRAVCLGVKEYEKRVEIRSLPSGRVIMCRALASIGGALGGSYYEKRDEGRDLLAASKRVTMCCALAIIGVVIGGSYYEKREESRDSLAASERVTMCYALAITGVIVGGI